MLLEEMFTLISSSLNDLAITLKNEYYIGYASLRLPSIFVNDHKLW